MSFKKLNPVLKSTLEEMGLESANAFQKKALPKIKSGADLYMIAPKGSGKTTALIISVIQQLNAEAFEDSPRALIFVKTGVYYTSCFGNFDRFRPFLYRRVLTWF